MSLPDELELLWKGVEELHFVRDGVPYFLEAVTQAVGVWEEVLRVVGFRHGACEEFLPSSASCLFGVAIEPPLEGFPRSSSSPIPPTSLLM